MYKLVEGRWGEARPSRHEVEVFNSSTVDRDVRYGVRVSRPAGRRYGMAASGTRAGTVPGLAIGPLAISMHRGGVFASLPGACRQAPLRYSFGALGKAPWKKVACSGCLLERLTFESERFSYRSSFIGRTHSHATIQPPPLSFLGAFVLRAILLGALPYLLMVL